MKLRIACAILALAAPFVLLPATEEALTQAIRGFDPASQAREITWEQRARVIPDAARIGASTVERYIDEIEKLPGRAPKPDLDEVRAEVTRLQETAADLDAAYVHALPNLGSASPEKLAALNGILFRSERALTIDPGLPGRPWYRHRIYAPGTYTGYKAKTPPGIREAVEAGKPDEARDQAAQVAQVLRALHDQIAEAVRLLAQIGTLNQL